MISFRQKFKKHCSQSICIYPHFVIQFSPPPFVSPLTNICEISLATFAIISPIQLSPHFTLSLSLSVAHALSMTLYLLLNFRRLLLFFSCQNASFVLTFHSKVVYNHFTHSLSWWIGKRLLGTQVGVEGVATNTTTNTSSSAATLLSFVKVPNTSVEREHTPHTVHGQFTTAIIFVRVLPTKCTSNRADTIRTWRTNSVQLICCRQSQSSKDDVDCVALPRKCSHPANRQFITDGRAHLTLLYPACADAFDTPSIDKLILAPLLRILRLAAENHLIPATLHNDLLLCVCSGVIVLFEIAGGGAKHRTIVSHGWTPPVRGKGRARQPTQWRSYVQRRQLSFSSTAAVDVGCAATSPWQCLLTLPHKSLLREVRTMDYRLPTVGGWCACRKGCGWLRHCTHTSTSELYIFAKCTEQVSVCIVKSQHCSCHFTL